MYQRTSFILWTLDSLYMKTRNMLLQVTFEIEVLVELVPIIQEDINPNSYHVVALALFHCRVLPSFLVPIV